MCEWRCERVWQFAVCVVSNCELFVVCRTNVYLYCRCQVQVDCQYVSCCVICKGLPIRLIFLCHSLSFSSLMKATKRGWNVVKIKYLLVCENLGYCQSLPSVKVMVSINYSIGLWIFFSDFGKTIHVSLTLEGYSLGSDNSNRKYKHLPQVIVCKMFPTAYGFISHYFMNAIREDIWYWYLSF